MYAQILLPPDYSVKQTKSGYEYSFSLKPGETVFYHIFDSFSGSVQSGVASATDRIFINYNDTITAWTENSSGLKSKIITLKKNKSNLSSKGSLEVLSPVEGEWANFQSLVVNVPDDTEVFYSYSGIDPLEFGFAYDGPVLLEMTGDISLEIAAIHSNGEISRKKINYSVIPNVNTKPPFNLTYSEPVIKCGVRNPVPIPDAALYSLDNGKSFMKARTLKQNFPSCINVTLPLIIKYNNLIYRYVIQTVDAPVVSGENKKKMGSPIQIIDWNFISFNANQNILYSVDDGVWKEYVEPFYLDRDTKHTISWKNGVFVERIDLPAKPSIVGVPVKGTANSGVELQFSNPVYTFCIEENGNISKPLTSFYVDTIYGHEQIFNLSLPVYYGNVRQGELFVSFSIDKKPPVPPVLKSTSSLSYEREPVAVSLFSDANVFVSVSEVRSFLDFYKDLNDLNESDIAPEDSAFTSFVGSRLILRGDDELAVKYDVFAYAEDLAGNKSDYSTYSIVIDKNNFYLDSACMNDEDDTEYSLGSPCNPFNSFQEALNVINTREKSILHIRGSFSQLPSLHFLSSCSLIGDANTHLSLLPDAIIRIRHGNFNFQNLSIKKEYTKNYRNFDNHDLQRSMINIDEADVLLNNCELIYNGNQTSTCISADSSKLSVLNSSITTSSSIYATALSCFRSKLHIDKLNFIVKSESSVGVSLSDCSVFLSNVSGKLTGKRTTDLDFTNTLYNMKNCDNLFLKKDSLSNITNEVMF